MKLLKKAEIVKQREQLKEICKRWWGGNAISPVLIKGVLF